MSKNIDKDASTKCSQKSLTMLNNLIQIHLEKFQKAAETTGETKLLIKWQKSSPENNSKAENKTKLEQRRAKKWEILEEKWKCLFSLENPTSDNHSLRKTLREEKRNYNFWTEENCASPKTTEMKEM